MTFSRQPIGSVVQPCSPSTPDRPVHWIEIELAGEDDRPIPWEEYQVVLPDGTVVKGYLDKEGFARLDHLETAGVCRVSFPALDRDAWQEIGTRPEKGWGDG